MRTVLVSLFVLFVTPFSAAACTPRDFLAFPIAHDDKPTWVTAILAAFPQLRVEGQKLLSDRGQISLTGPTGRSPKDLIASPSMGDQFVFLYPLDRDLEARKAPYMDPGRIRHEPFFKLLYGANRDDVRASLQTVRAGIGQNPQFEVTTQHGVACQLETALEALGAEPGLGPFFREIGGSFNWREIAGTNRLSTHSFGIAIDINASLGGYWRWSGGRDGAAGPFNNKVPWVLIETMERYGFIWGGKWHHFDGMHFEYRPELILFSRLVGGPPQGLEESLK